MRYGESLRAGPAGGGAAILDGPRAEADGLLRDVLDRMVKEKEIAAAFFHRVADCVEDVDQRRWFRRMAQDEKDQRKILLKHRRELCGTVPAQPPIPVSAVHEVLERAARGSASLEDALRLAVQSAEEAQTACDRAADLVGDRSCRIFLKILCQESLSHREELVGALRRFERERSSAAEDVAA